jgi:cold shock CspA family protein
MRFTGKLKTWDGERGFGFITPSEGGQDLFVHVSELPRGERPNLDAMLSFEVALNPQGKKKAVKVRRVDAPSSGSRRDTSIARPRNQPTFRKSGRTVAVLAMIALAGCIAYERYGDRVVSKQPSSPLHSAAPAASLFSCDGRTHCSQMTSCAEATYFLKNCPGTQMDGNRDGVPCEQQWCR